jgi:periplasmic protein TonB
MPEQKAEVKETDLPKDVPTETDDPDRVVTPNEVKKPIEDDTKVATVQTQASQESAAAEATAAPSVENAPQAERSVAPAQGIGESLQRVRLNWQRELVAHFDRHKRYPADRDRKSAEVLVSFVLDRLGHVLSASIAKGSGDPAFDEAALAMIHRSDPVPLPPPAVADEGLSFTIPVDFRVKGKG